MIGLAGWDCRDSEVGCAARAVAYLGEFVFCSCEADLESFYFAEPAFAFGFGYAVVQVTADLFEPGALGGVWPQK